MVKKFEAFINDKGELEEFDNTTYVIFAIGFPSNIYLSQIDPFKFVRENKARDIYHFNTLEEAINIKNNIPKLKSGSKWGIYEYNPNKTIALGDRVG